MVLTGVQDAAGPRKGHSPPARWEFTRVLDLLSA